MTAKASAAFRCEGRRLHLERQVPAFLGLGKPRSVPVPLDQWQALCPPAAGEALAWLQSASPELVTREAASLLLDPAIIAALPVDHAAALGLPPCLPLTRAITVQGQLHLDAFALETWWTSGAGARERVTGQDGLLRWDGRLWHAPAWAGAVEDAVQKVNAARTMAQRVEALAALQGLVDACVGAPLAADRQVADLRVRHAAGLSLRIVIEEGVARFAPVLFSRDAMRLAAAGQGLDEAEHSLLPPALARDWAAHALAGPGRDVYLLRDGSILALDPRLARVMAALPQAARLAPEDRRAFVIAPGTILAKACGLPGDEIHAVLVETVQYTQAVGRLDAWRRRVRPWFALAGDGRSLVAQGLCLGEEAEAEWLELPSDRLSVVLAQANLALTARQTGFAWAATTVPATAATRSALQALLHLAAALPGDAPLPDDLAKTPFCRRDAAGHVLASGPLAGLLETAVAAPAPQPAPQPTLPIWPASIALHPAPHQQAAFAWLAEHWLSQDGGAIWADAPGLGARLALLAFLRWLGPQSSLPALLVAPPFGLAAWQAALARHVPDLAAQALVVADGEAADLSAAALVLTSYEILRDMPQQFARQSFAVLVLDQAEHLRTPVSQAIRAVQMLDVRFRLARIAPPLDPEQDSLHAALAAVGRAGDPGALAQALWLLHRRREDCLQSLPPCHDHVIATAMPARQREAYDHLLQRAQALRGCGDPARMAHMLDQLDLVSRAAFVPGDRVADLAEVSGRIAGLLETLPAIVAQGEQAIVVCHDAPLRAALRPLLADRFGDGVVLVDPADPPARHDPPPANHVLLLTRARHPVEHEAILAHVHRLGQQRPVHVYWLQAVHPDAALAGSSFDALHDAAWRQARGGLIVPPRDTPALFDAVVVPLPEAPPAQVPVAAPRRTGRLALGAGRGARPSPLPAEELAALRRGPVVPSAAPLPPLTVPPPARWAARVEFIERKERDFGIFLAPVQSDPAVQCRLVDPYAAAGSWARMRTAEFLRKVLGANPLLQEMRLETFDGEGLDQWNPEDDRAQREDMLRQWARVYPNGPALRFTQHPRRETKNIMHDRNLSVTTQSGRRLIWDMGRGVDGVMRKDFRCVVTLTEA